MTEEQIDALELRMRADLGTFVRQMLNQRDHELNGRIQDITDYLVEKIDQYLNIKALEFYHNLEKGRKGT